MQDSYRPGWKFGLFRIGLSREENKYRIISELQFQKQKKNSEDKACNIRLTEVSVLQGEPLDYDVHK